MTKHEIGGMLPPIPVESVKDWKEIPVEDNGEELVPVGAFSEFSDCDTSSAYFGERGQDHEMNFLGQPVDRRTSLICHFVRKGVLERLQLAQRLLPDGYFFKFYDNYRPLEVQQALFDTQKEVLRGQHPDWDEAKLEEEAQTYVSLPSPNLARQTKHPSPHSTGGVVDLTIIKMSDQGQKELSELDKKKESGQLDYPISAEEQVAHQLVAKWIDSEAERQNWSPEYRQEVENDWLVEYRYAREKARIFRLQTTPLNMGTEFDYLDKEAGMRFFEDESQTRQLTDQENEALKNRRFFYQIMTQAGFANYPEEWWHWSIGDSMAAANKGLSKAIYGTAIMSQDNINFENARRGPYFTALNRIGQKGLFVEHTEDDPRQIAA